MELDLSRIDGLLFDLGGVVFDFDFTEAFQRVSHATGIDLATISQRFVVDDAYERLERGQLSAEEYWKHLRGLLAIDVTDHVLLGAWNSIFGSEIPGISRALERAAALRPTWALSNTNAMHVEAFQESFAGLLSAFTGVLASNEIGHRKPDPEAYLIAAQIMGTDPDHVLFFDDLERNVEGARAVGMQAVVVSSTADVDAVLDALAGSLR